jgi:Yip1-like protein
VSEANAQPIQATVQTAAPAAPPKGLLTRAFGVVFSPRATYAAVVARPRALGALVFVIVIVAAATSAFLTTEVGKNAYIDQALSSMEGFGVKVTDQMMTGIERQAQYAPYVTSAAQVIFVPLVAVIIAGLALAVFNAILGGDATFKQAFSVVAHSYFIVALGALFSMPLFYLRESMASATSVSIFFPMVDEATFLGRLTGSLDLFRIWWIVSLSIGLGVLYKRRTGPIAWTLLGLYLIIVLIIAGVRTALSGA